MAFETLTQPTNEAHVGKLYYELSQAFFAKGISVIPDSQFGDLSKEYFGLNLDDSNKGVNLGFMQIIFNPDASWQVLVPQSPLGRRSLNTLAEIINRPIDETKLGTWDVNYACYTYVFPIEPQPTSS